MKSIYSPITPIFFDKTPEEVKRVVLYDPTKIYSRINIDKHKRWQSIGMNAMFPNVEKDKCACGCGNKLTGKQRRWYEPSHADFLALIHKIINGDIPYIKFLMQHYLPYECCKCHCEPYTIETCKVKKLWNGHEYKSYNWMAGIQVDHILAVKNGGGGCWLGNYQFICHKCHSNKTIIDNQIRNKPTQLPLSTLFT